MTNTKSGASGLNLTGLKCILADGSTLAGASDSMQNVRSEGTPGDDLPRQPNLNVVVPNVIDLCSSSSEDELVDKSSTVETTVRPASQAPRQGDVTSEPPTKPISATLLFSPKPRDASRHVHHNSSNKHKPAPARPKLGQSKLSTNGIAIRSNAMPPSNVTKKRPHSGVTASVPPGKKRHVQDVKPSLDVVNDVDDAVLPENFEFVAEYVFRNGTRRISQEFRAGCSCGPQNGRNVGCEYVQKCQCIQDAAREGGKIIGFAYHAEGTAAGCLQTKYLKTRHVIYECSDLCNCGPRCRNKVVQHGRQIPLEIFRTRHKGWGLRATVNIRHGQFIDTYRGEVIDNAEADRREEASNDRTKDSYLFSLDKFVEIYHGDTSELYVVDGEFMGGPTRFMNHSCDPNCATFAVSTTVGDDKVYELAFFALEDIPAGTELTFDYIDDDEDRVASKDDADKARRAQDTSELKGKLATRCLCGSEECRGFLWL